MRDKYFTTAMRAVNLLFMSLLKDDTNGAVLVVMSTHQSASKCFTRILETLQPRAKYIPLTVSHPTLTIRFGGKVLKVEYISSLERSIRGVELQSYWLDEATKLTPEQIGLLESRVRK